MCRTIGDLSDDPHGLFLRSCSLVLLVDSLSLPFWLRGNGCQSRRRRSLGLNVWHLQGSTGQEEIDVVLNAVSRESQVQDYRLVFSVEYLGMEFERGCLESRARNPVLAC